MLTPREAHSQLQNIVTTIQSHRRLSGEGREQELRAYLRDWFQSKLLWPAAEVRGSEKYDLQLLDGAGLYAIYVETKDPDVGITDEELKKALARARALPGLRWMVITDGWEYRAYTPGRSKPEFTVSLKEGEKNLDRLLKVFDPDAYSLDDPKAPVLSVADGAARRLLVARLRELVPALGTEFAILAREGLAGDIHLPGLHGFFDEWLLYSYGITFSEMASLLAGSDDMPAGWRGRDPTDVLDSIFPALSRDAARELADGVTTQRGAKKKRAALAASLDLLEGVGALRLFADQTALVVTSRMLFARILQEGRSAEIVPREVILRRMQEDRASGALNVYVETRRSLYQLDHALYGLGLYDWWQVSDPHIEGWKDDDRRHFNAWSVGANQRIAQIWHLVLRFTFSGAVRDVLREVYENLLPPTERILLGGFYTDEGLADFLLGLAGYEGEGRLIDISSGSGTFLIGALARYLPNAPRPRSVDGAVRELQRVGESITGIDIHPFAVVLGQLNMVLNLAPLVVRALPHTTVPTFVHEGDSLDVGGATAERHPELAALAAAFNGRAIEVLRRRETAEQLKGERFDLVVGNPPWGGVLVAGRPLSRREYKGYRTLSRKTDIYALFMERAAHMLADGGAMAFVTQNRYLSRDYGIVVQRLLTGQVIPGFHVEAVIDLGQLGGRLFFPTETTYPCLTVARKVPKGEEPPDPILLRARVVEGEDLPSKGDLLEALAKAVRQTARRGKASIEGPGYEIEGSKTTQERLIELTERTGRWPIPVPEDDDEPVGTVVAVSDLFEIAQGATPGGSGEVSGKAIFLLSREEAERHDIERALLRPVVDSPDIVGEEIERPEMVALYPYRSTSQGVATENLGAGIRRDTNQGARSEVLKMVRDGKIKYPNAALYLASHYVELFNREYEGKKVGINDPVWYKWHRAREPRDLLARPKIIVRRMFSEDVCSLDLIGALPLDGCWVLSPKLDGDGWHNLREALKRLVGRSLDDGEILRRIARTIRVELPERLRNADTEYRGGFLRLKKDDLESLTLELDDLA